MRRLVLFVLIIIGAAAGAAVGYAVAAMEASLSTSFVDPRPSNKQGFDRTVDDFARLGGYEAVAANCNGTSDTQPALRMEAEAIRDLQQDKGSGINQLSVAEARLLVRILIVSEKDPSANHPKAETAQRVETLLKSAGWSNFSEAHLRDIVRELDDDQCRQIVLGDGR